MHYTGTIWRPPYEAGSLLLEVTAGCTHHRCKFCTLYEDLPFRFRMSPLEQVESDLREAQMLLNSPMEKLAARLQSLPPRPAVRRVFLVGANPFVLRFDRLKAIAELIGTYLPSCETIGCFARVTDVALKSDGELRELRHLGYDGLSIGVETGDDQALAFMDKGYQAKDIVEQAQRLDHAGIGYCFMYLAGLAGEGRPKRHSQRGGLQPDPPQAHRLLHADRLPRLPAVSGGPGGQLDGGGRAGKAGGAAGADRQSPNPDSLRDAGGLQRRLGGGKAS